MVIGQFAQDSSGVFVNNRASNGRVWAGRVVSGLVTLFLLVDGITKLIKADASVEGSVDLGYPARTVVWIGLTLLVCTVLYALPRTAILGAVLLTGYLGGAVATQVRVESPDVLFALGFGVLVWLGLCLRDARVRNLLKA